MDFLEYVNTNLMFVLPLFQLAVALRNVRRIVHENYSLATPEMKKFNYLLKKAMRHADTTPSTRV